MSTPENTTPSAPRPSVTRDLINVGVFTALYFVILAILGQLGALVPITQVLAPFYLPIVCGIPFMLFLTRVKRFGMITAMGWIIGLLLLLTGMPLTVLPIAFVLAVAADLVARTGGYKRWWSLVAAYAIFSEILIGTVVPLFFQRDAFLARRLERQGEVWTNQIEALTPSWMFFVMIVMLAVGAVIGAYLGRAIFRKHYRYLAPAGLDSSIASPQPQDPSGTNA